MTTHSHRVFCLCGRHWTDVARCFLTLHRQPLSLFSSAFPPSYILMAFPLSPLSFPSLVSLSFLLSSCCYMWLPDLFLSHLCPSFALWCQHTHTATVTTTKNEGPARSQCLVCLLIFLFCSTQYISFYYTSSWTFTLPLSVQFFFLSCFSFIFFNQLL